MTGVGFRKMRFGSFSSVKTGRTLPRRPCAAAAYSAREDTESLKGGVFARNV